LGPGRSPRQLQPARAQTPARTRIPRRVRAKPRYVCACATSSDLERACQRKKAADKELSAALKAADTTLTSLQGIGPSGAARLLVEVADITRFPDRGHFASWNGTAPIDASSGDHVRHRLSRAGNRQINRVLHIMAVVQLRHPTKGRAYYDRKAAAGKTPVEAVRALKRRLSDVVFRQMMAGARAARTGPGGHEGAATDSSAAGSDPSAGISDKSLPGPATSDPTPGSQPILPVIPANPNPRRTAAAVKWPVLDGGENRRTLVRRKLSPLDTEGSHERKRLSVTHQDSRLCARPAVSRNAAPA
jgi:transposase